MSLANWFSELWPIPPALPRPALDSPAGLFSPGWAGTEQGLAWGWGQQRGLRISRLPVCFLYLRWLEAPRDGKRPPGEFTGIEEEEAGRRPSEGLVGLGDHTLL